MNRTIKVEQTGSLKSDLGVLIELPNGMKCWQDVKPLQDATVDRAKVEELLTAHGKAVAAWCDINQDGNPAAIEKSRKALMDYLFGKATA